jgi:hypothetical protein
MANVMIDIAAEFTGNKAFKQADSATDKLTKNVKQLAATFGLAFGTTQVLAYGKAAVKAAAADEKAQKQLALALKNVGLGRDAAASEEYIQRLQTEFGIVDDLLRPAYQSLAVATGNTAEAQRLLNLSLDISASTGKELGSVTAALSRAYLGNNAALSRLGVGISKADLKAKSFEEITTQLQSTFAGSATAAANTFQGSIDKLAVASANASEIIGTGLIDALTNLGKDTSVADLAANMEKTATYIADVIRGVGVLAGKLKDLPIIGSINVGMIPIVGTYLTLLREAGKQFPIQKASDNAHLKSLESQSKITDKILNTSKKLTADELKKLKAKRLQNAIDKATAALAKGSDIFDIDQIQIAAALANQTEQLGRASTSAQALQIANDIARLNVKKSINELEDAIAAKDEAAIIAATKKLNEDMKILGILGQQNVKLLDIKSILDSLLPKDLINLQNLKDAIALLGQIKVPGITPPAGGGGGGGGNRGGGVGGVNPAAASLIDLRANTTPGSPINVLLKEHIDEILSSSVMPAVDEQSQRAAMKLLEPGTINAGSSFDPARFRAGENGDTINITVQAGIGDPNAIAEAIDQVLTDAVQRGTLRGYVPA